MSTFDSLWLAVLTVQSSLTLDFGFLWLWFTVIPVEFKDLGGNFDQQQVDDMGFGR